MTLRPLREASAWAFVGEEPHMALTTCTEAKLFRDYAITAFDEMFTSRDQVRSHYKALFDRFSQLPPPDIERRSRLADGMMRQQGITFTVYGRHSKESTGKQTQKQATRKSATERIMPFDPIPRLVPAHEWDRIESGLCQRVRALNLFIHDVYHDRHILKDGIVPPELVFGASGYRREMNGIRVPHDIYIHVSGIDLIRDASGEYLVLEDNCRTPSGVSYVLKNREVMKQAFPFLFEDYSVRPVDDYAANLLSVLQYSAPIGVPNPNVVVLTPGAFNSAYYEHSFLARQMGVQLVEGRDLVLDNGGVFMRTTRGLERVDVIYRRVDDDYLDPLCFRRDSRLGVAGLLGAYRTGRLGMANAIGPGVADDKAIYPFVPEMIRYYLREDPILKNVETYRLTVPSQKQHVLANLDKLVVKAVDASGGYGMLIGPASTAAQRAEFHAKIEANPRGYIAQPTIMLSQSPTIVDGGTRIEGRHIDLRPFVLYGEQIRVLPGGLTRVALPRGSLVVNSSQGGGSKDTWVLRSAAPASAQQGAGI